MKTKQISDLNLAAYLTTAGHRLVGVEGDRYRAFFVFEDTPKLAQDTLTFYNREGRVEPLAFSEMARHLKGLAMNQN